MDPRHYFLQQADRCFSIARTCLDNDAARKIDDLGHQFLHKADEAGLEQPGAPAKPPREEERQRDFAPLLMF